MGYRAAAPADFLLPRDFGRPPAITEPEAIAALLEGLRNCYFVNDGGFLTAVKLRDREEYIYLYLPYDAAPQYIRDRFE
jgi:hypothetical protein